MIPWLDAGTPAFPATRLALQDPNGLLAAGGELSADWLKQAYPRGIFPWFNEGEPILWWSPSPRCVLFPKQFHLSRSLRKRMRQLNFEVRCDQQFTNVMRQCAAPREDQAGTWISDAFISAYSDLAQQQIAHSVELYVDQQLVGGLYGLSIGRVFFGESMFSIERDASKICLYYLAERARRAGFAVIDCQVWNPHLASLGACEIPRQEFDKLLKLCNAEPVENIWRQTQWSLEE